jgi:hypothetical protein
MKSLQLFSVSLLFSGIAFAQAPTIAGCPAFPANNVWNTRIDNLPLDPHSADYINNITASGTLRYDITMPINIVSGTQAKVPLVLEYPDESDPGPYPIPPNPKLEEGSDLHIFTLDKDNCVLYETFYSIQLPDGSWDVYSAAKWSLLSNALRPAYWTSGDAAGLPMTVGLIRYDEVNAGQLNHAIRFTAPRTQRLFIWPGRHYASQNTSAALPPMGQRFRLKAGFDITPYPPRIQTILRAMKQYGMFLADNGLAWEMQFELDSRWDTSELDVLRQIPGGNFEAVDESSLIVNIDSGEARQSGAAVTVAVTPSAASLSGSQQKQFVATVAGSSLGVNWSVSPQIGSISSTGLYTAPPAISSTQTVTVSATLTDGSASGKATVTLTPVTLPSMASVSVSPSSVTGGANVNVTVTLTGPAAPGGAAIALTGSNGAFPAANVTVAAGATSQTFSVPTAVVNGITVVTVAAAYNGSSAGSGQLTVLAPAGANPATAAFVKTDTTTAGSWKGVYGTEGSLIPLDSTSVPSYVSVTPSGGAILYPWAGSTAEARALQKGSASDRIASCWYNPTSFDVDIRFTDGNAHQVALYLLDWDSTNQRTERVDVLDVNNNVLDTRSASNFSSGRYLVWNLSGHVILRFTNTSIWQAVASGFFFGPAGGTTTPPVTNPPTNPPATGSSSAAFVKADTTVSGSWSGAYGSDGYYIINNSASLPSYVTLSGSGYYSYVWAGSTSEPRALQKPNSSDRIAPCWYHPTGFNVDLNFTDGKTHQVAFYLLDWDSANLRSERIDVLDAANGNVLDTRSAANFSNGQYLVWNLGGHVVLRFTNTSQLQAVVSGLFFGPAGGTTTPPVTNPPTDPPTNPPTGNGVSFVKADTTTGGAWQGVYGNTGYYLINHAANVPSFVNITSSNNSSYVWTGSTTEARAPQKINASDRIAACWYSGGAFSVDLNFTDGKSHQVAVYLLDWDSANMRSERIDVLDAAGNVLDTRSASNFSAGQYLVWNLSGHVVLRFTNTSQLQAVVSGFFF